MSAIRFGTSDETENKNPFDGVSELTESVFGRSPTPEETDAKLKAALLAIDEDGAIYIIDRPFPKYDPSRKDNDAIITACGLGLTKVVRKLLGMSKVDPSARHNQAIIEAARYGRTDVVRMLLRDQEVDPSDQGNEALSVAIEGQHADVASLLWRDARVKSPVTVHKRSK